MTTRVSAIIPVYNRAESLPAAVESLVATRYADLEIVIVDDGSEDESATLARDLAIRHPSLVRVAGHPDGRNHGPGASRNLGVRLSTGEYVCFLDSDDRVLPHRFEVAVQVLDADETIDAVCEPCAVEDASGELVVRDSGRSPGMTRILGPGVRWNTNSIVVRKRNFLRLGGFSESLRTCEDLVLWMKLALAANLAEGSSRPVALYRLHGRNSEIVLENSWRAHLEVLRWSRGRRLDSAKMAALRDAVWGKTLFVCDRLKAEGRSGAALGALLQTARAQPAAVFRPAFWKNLLAIMLRRR